MTDLHTEYLGLPLRSPIVASAGPLTSDVDRIVELERAGVGAVVLPSLFEEQIEHDTNEIDRLYSLHDDSFGEASSMLPEVDDYNGGDDRYLELIGSAKAAVGDARDRQPERHEHRRMAAIRPCDRGRRRRRDRDQPVLGGGRPDRHELGAGERARRARVDRRRRDRHPARGEDLTVLLVAVVVRARSPTGRTRPGS